jgi:hypothetical protein
MCHPPIVFDQARQRFKLVQGLFRLPVLRGLI